MAHDGGGVDDLPATWPFRAAATVLVAALVWFCLGFGLEDVNAHLPAHFTLFWAGVAVGLVLTVGGALANVQRERRRKRHG